MNAGGLGDIEAAVRGGLVPSVLGDSAADLTFTPVTPCRVVTRSAAAGLLVAGAPRAFYVRNRGGFATQGGSATDCGIPATATAVEMNFVAVGPAAAGTFALSLRRATCLGLGDQLFERVRLNIANGVDAARLQRGDDDLQISI